MGRGTITCQHPILFSNLEGDFNRLMESYGVPVHLASNETINAADACGGLSEADLSASVRDLIYKQYADDYSLLVYLSTSRRRVRTGFRPNRRRLRRVHQWWHVVSNRGGRC